MSIEKCIICQNDFAINNIGSGKIKHILNTNCNCLTHKTCLDNYMDFHIFDELVNCPSCRQEILKHKVPSHIHNRNKKQYIKDEQQRDLFNQEVLRQEQEDLMDIQSEINDDNNQSLIYTLYEYNNSEEWKELIDYILHNYNSEQQEQLFIPIYNYIIEIEDYISLHQIQITEGTYKRILLNGVRNILI